MEFPFNLPLRLTASVQLPLGGKSWPVLFSHRALLDAELATGLSILNGEFRPGMLSAKALRATVQTLLAMSALPSPAPYTEREVGALLGLKALGQIRAAVVEAWRVSMPEPEPGADRPSREASRSTSKSGPPTWLEIWANNRESLRLSDDQWLAYTPRMVQQLARERLEIDRRWELQISRVAEACANFSMCHPKDPVPVGYYMVRPWPKPDRRGGGDLLSALSGLGGMFPLAEKLAGERAASDKTLNTKGK